MEPSECKTFSPEIEVRHIYDLWKKLTDQINDEDQNRKKCPSQVRKDYQMEISGTLRTELIDSAKKHKHAELMVLVREWRSLLQV